MNNIFCHIVGINEIDKAKLLSRLNKYNIKLIDLDAITKNIATHSEFKELYEEYAKIINDPILKIKHTSRYKELDKEMINYWKKLFEKKVKGEINIDKINIVVGLSNHYKSTRTHINMNAKFKFFLETDNYKNAKTVVKHNLDTYRHQIINGSFPVKYLDVSFVIKERNNIFKIYEKKNIYLKI